MIVLQAIGIAILVIYSLLSYWGWFVALEMGMGEGSWWQRTIAFLSWPFAPALMLFSMVAVAYEAWRDQ